MQKRRLSSKVPASSHVATKKKSAAAKSAFTETVPTAGHLTSKKSGGSPAISSIRKKKLPPSSSAYASAKKCNTPVATSAKKKLSQKAAANLSLAFTDENAFDTSYPTFAGQNNARFEDVLKKQGVTTEMRRMKG